MPYKDKNKQREYLARHYIQNKKLYSDRTKATRQKVVDYVKWIKSNTPCADCKVQYPYWVMDFDHREEKVDSISRLVRFSTMNKVLKEIAKCDIVCSNCHRDRTQTRLNK